MPYVLYYKDNGEIFRFISTPDDYDENIMGRIYVDEDIEDILKPCYKVEDNKLVFDINKYKQMLLNKLKLYVEWKGNQGYFSQTINNTICSRRLDLENMTNLYDYMTEQNIDTIQFRIYDNSFVNITKDQLKMMISELRAYGLYLYQKKWELEQQIQQATDKKVLDQIRNNELYY